MVGIREIIDVLQNDLQRKGIPYLSHVKQINNNLMVTCPYHKNGREQSPSCGILLNDRNVNSKIHKAGTVHCFTCGETHTLEEMISHVYGKNDKGTYGKEWLLENFQILSTNDIVFDYEFTIEPLQKSVEIEYSSYKQYHPYMAHRGISEKVADAFELGYDKASDSIVLPLFDKDNKCIMLIKRAVDAHRYMNTSGASKTDSVFGIQMVYKKLNQLVNSPYVFVVEGPFDVLKMWENGFPAVGIMQASISETQINLIKKLPFQKIVIATDNDEAGRSVANKLADKLSDSKEVFILQYPKGIKDPGDMTAEQFKTMKLEEYHGKKARYTTSLY